MELGRKIYYCTLLTVNYINFKFLQVFENFFKNIKVRSLRVKFDKLEKVKIEVYKSKIRVSTTT